MSSFRAAFTFSDNKLGVTGTGDDFDAFKSHFGPDDRGFGYIKIMVRHIQNIIQCYVLIAP